MAVVALGVLAAPLPAPAAAPPDIAASVANEQTPTGSVRWPLAGAVVRPFEPPAGVYGPGHRGVDIAAPAGTRVHAALAGTVTFAGQVAGQGWVTVDHGGGLQTTYGDVRARLVSAGQQVEAGQALGHLAAGAAHLDWGARLDGAYIDPLTLFGRWQPYLVPLAR